MKIFENGVLRDATAEEVERVTNAQVNEEKVIVQMSLDDVIRLLAPKLFAEVPDKTALHMVAFFPKWEDFIGKQVDAGGRYQDDGKLYECVQSHTPQSDWHPKDTPALWKEVSIEEWPEWKRPTGAHDAYNKGDKVTYNGAHYVSLIDANVYSPDEYPAGWEAKP